VGKAIFMRGGACAAELRLIRVCFDSGWPVSCVGFLRRVFVSLRNVSFCYFWGLILYGLGALCGCGTLCVYFPSRSESLSLGDMCVWVVGCVAVVFACVICMD
jgi:hypothetical protein